MPYIKHIFTLAKFVRSNETKKKRHNEIKNDKEIRKKRKIAIKLQS